jgi:hypothetical protein
MQTEADVKRLQDRIDQLSSWSEKLGISLRSLIKFLGRKVIIGIMFLLFGVIIGIFGNFFKALIGGKEGMK